MLKIGDLLGGKYRILSVVGRGGMSTVYLARNERANKNWAVKEVRKSGVKSGSGCRAESPDRGGDHEASQ